MEERKEIEQLFWILYRKHVGSTQSSTILLNPPPRQQCSGEITLGTVQYNDQSLYPFDLRKGELCQHLAIFGRSGSGKTNTIRKLMGSLLKAKVPMLVFDWKRDYSLMDFAQVYGPSQGIGDSERGISVYSAGRRNSQAFHFNPLIPPKGTDPAVWAKKLVEIFTHAYIGGAGFESLFLKAFDHVYREFGVYSGNQSNYPTMLDVKAFLESMKTSGRSSQWMQSVMRTVEFLCFAGMGEMLNVREQAGFDELLKKNVILELDALCDADKTFLIESMLLWIHHHRMNLGHTDGQLQQVIIIEEAHHILRNSYEQKETVVDVILREIRSMGVGVIVVDQMPSLISRVALANTYCTISMNLKTAEDVNAIARCMLMSTDQREHLGRLPVGSAIVKLQDRFVDPFLVKVPLVDVKGKLREPVVDYAPGEPSIGLAVEAKERGRKSSNQGIRGGIAGIPNARADILGAKKNDGQGRRLSTQIKRGKPVRNSEEELLIDIASCPTDMVTERYQRLELSNRKGNHIRKKLVDQGLIKPVTISGLKGWIRLFEVTSPGWAKLRSLGVERSSNRHGSLEHLYWVGTVANELRRRGFQVEVEAHIGDGKTVDVVWMKGVDRVAIEVETGKSDILGNVEKCVSNDFNGVVSVATNEKVKARTIEALGKTSVNQAQVKVMTVRQFLNESVIPLEKSNPKRCVTNTNTNTNR